jgi:hypothetical protein
MRSHSRKPCARSATSCGVIASELGVLQTPRLLSSASDAPFEVGTSPREPVLDLAAWPVAVRQRLLLLGEALGARLASRRSPRSFPSRRSPGPHAAGPQCGASGMRSPLPGRAGGCWRRGRHLPVGSRWRGSRLDLPLKGAGVGLLDAATVSVLFGDVSRRWRGRRECSLTLPFGRLVLWYRDWYTVDVGFSLSVPPRWR